MIENKIHLVKDGVGAVEYILSFRTPTFANIKMKDELKEINGVEINGVLITCQDSTAAMKASDVLQTYLTPMNKAELATRISKWKYLFYKPYNSTMEEVEERSQAILEQLAELPADCVHHALGMAIRTYKIFPSFSEVFGIMKNNVNERQNFATQIDKILDQLHQ